jgi:crotonobetainyl-CoA:carnitine CoA-transferase CaiB-like acyl-CoA transferase
MANQAAGPLKGIKVLDLTQFINGPSATGQLQDNGADVIKVEPAAGEGMRPTVPSGALNVQMEVYNRGKRSITLDLKHPDAVEVMRRLCVWADVLAENFRPDVMDRLGFGYEVVSKWNPRIIYASNSGFGPAGEWALRPSYDGMAQAFTGALAYNGGGPSHAPREVPWVFSDVIGGQNFYGAILAALLARANGPADGPGQHVVTSQTAATLFFQRGTLAGVLNTHAGVQNDTGETDWQRSPIQQVHRTSDGKWICASMTQARQYEAFVVKALGRPDLMKPAIVSKWPVPSKEDSKWLMKEIGEVISGQTFDHWSKVIVDADVPFSPVASYAQVGDPESSVGRHLYANGYMASVDHRDYGSLKWAAPPTEFRGTPLTPLQDRHGKWQLAYIGEHRRQALVETLGFTESEAERLMSSGAVPAPVGPHTEEAARENRAAYRMKLEKRKAGGQAKL